MPLLVTVRVGWRAAARSLPDGSPAAWVEELHACSVHGECDLLAHRDLGAGVDAGYAFAGLGGGVLVVAGCALGPDPAGIDGEVDHELRAERLDQVHGAGQRRPGSA